MATKMIVSTRKSQFYYMKIKTLLCIGMLVFLYSCQQSAPVAEQKGGYLLQTIQQDSVVLSSLYSASIKGEQEIKIVPRVDGHLTAVKIHEGDIVKEGQVMFIIDQVPYEAQLNAANAAVSMAEANVATAQLNYNSTQTLFKKNVVSEFDLLSAENGLKTAKAQLLQAEAQAHLALNNLSYTVVKSPSDGVAGKIPYREGDYVSPAIMDGLTVVANNSRMFVYFSMSERKIMDLIAEYGTAKQAIEEMPDIQLQLSNQKIYGESGRVESISGVIDPTTGAVSVRAVFPNAQQMLLSGGTGNVVFPYIYPNAMIISQEATFEIQDKTYVYKVIDGKASATVVTVEEINDGKQYVVSEGLSVGDVIVAEGAGLVQEGMLIESK